MVIVVTLCWPYTSGVWVVERVQIERQRRQLGVYWSGTKGKMEIPA